MQYFIRMKNTQAQDQARKLKRNPRLILLILIIMFLVISQLIVLLVNSTAINQSPEPVSVNEQAITLDDLKAVNTDLNEVRKSLNEINNKPDYIEVKNVESKPDVVLPAPEVVKKDIKKEGQKTVNAELNEVRKNLHEINSNSFSEDDLVDANKVEIKAAVVPPSPVVVIKHKENIKPKQKITENKKVVLVEKNPVIVIPVPVSSDDQTTQSIEKPADKVITVTDIKPAYIKYDINGNTLDDNNEQWTCVSDTKSSLMWEIKSKDDAMRNPNNLYSWFNPDIKALKGVADGGRCKGATNCDTNAYVEAMNEQKFCGHNDWRLPTREEMMGLVSFGSGDNTIKIDTSYFPQTLPSWYWTASPNESHPEFAWYILFKKGISLNDLKENPKHIRLVRSESSS